jgi:hypothetical protein
MAHHMFRRWFFWKRLEKMKQFSIARSTTSDPSTIMFRDDNTAGLLARADYQGIKL